MKRVLLFAGVGIALGAASVALAPSSWLFTVPQSLAGESEPGVRWACAMMDYIADSRGNGSCPVCGMTLQRITAGALSAEQRRRMDLQTEVLATGPALITIRAYGAARFDQRGKQVVVPRISGRVVKRHGGALHHGMTVQIGDPLVDVYSPQVLAAQGELAAAIAAGDKRLIDAVTARFSRWNLLDIATAVQRGSVPTDTVTIRSPFAGLVVVPEAMEGGAVSELPEVGRELMADQALLTLVDQAKLMVVIHVPETQSRLLRLGQSVDIASDDAGELIGAAARISWLAPEINLDNRSREIHLHLDDPKGRLFAGSLVSARIRAALGPDMEPADPDDASTWGSFTLVPKSAVLSTGVRHVAWRRLGDGSEQRFELASLALGPRLEDATGRDLYVVRAGLKAGDVVATQGAFLIDSQAQLAGSASLLFPDGAVRSGGHAH